MNHIIRNVIKTKDIFKYCDFMAVRNPNKTYLIMYNIHGINGLVDNETFKLELVKSETPIVLHSNLFSEYV